MNVRLIELRAGDRKIEYNTVVMSKLIHTQNKIITDELGKLGISVGSLKPALDLERELKKRSDAAYLAVKNKVDKAKRSEAEKAAAKAASMNAAAAGAGGVVPGVAGGSNNNSPAVAAAAAAAAAASRLPPAPAAAPTVKTEDVKPVVATLAATLAQNQVAEMVVFFMPCRKSAAMQEADRGWYCSCGSFLRPGTMRSSLLPEWHT